VLLVLYLEALDEELVTLRSSINTHKLTSTMKVEELKEETLSGKGHTEIVERYYAVRQILFLCPGLGVVDVCMDTNRQIQLCRPSYAYSVEGPVGPFAHQTSLMPSPLKDGDHSNSISRSVSPTFLPVLVTNLQTLRAA
jgi:hypothetical protein